MELDQPLKSLNDLHTLFDFLKKSRTAADILQDFLPLWSSGEIEIREFTPEVRDGILKCEDLKNATDAAFIFDGQSRVIFIDLETEMGVLAPLLLHEIIHSLDRNYLETHSECHSRFEKLRTRGFEILENTSFELGVNIHEIDESHCKPSEVSEIRALREAAEAFEQLRLYRSERRAYTRQFQMTCELFNVRPEYRSYLQSRTKWAPVLTGLVTDQQIIERYRLKEKYIKAS